MSHVVCPNCGNEVRSYNRYFCSVCGHKLDIPSKPHPHVVDIPITIAQDKAYSFKRIYIIYLLVFLALCGVIALFYMKTAYRYKTLNKKVESSQILPKQTLSSAINITTGLLDESGMSKYAAFDSLYYFEGFDAQKLLDMYLASKTPLYSSELNSIYPLVSGRIAFFGNSSSWTLLAEKKSPDSYTNIDMKDLTFGDIDNFYYISNNPDVFKELLYAKEKVTKSFGMHPSYITLSRSLSTKAVKAFLYVENKNTIMSFFQTIGFSNTELAESISKAEYTYFVVL